MHCKIIFLFAYFLKMLVEVHLLGTAEQLIKREGVNRCLAGLSCNTAPGQQGRSSTH